ncbi:MerR family transcriptional regulator [Actinosynnema mirum]|uniref:Transcriptional regulator, MerR family n=1 Tax=Actinosynnema mirum (strain ATCC 29888 / DSM 43827 / JCM 3225 / NBRC 14064 / NCIMB 13271 / NRRL B-12336 / IMRU 3971 / 101) TaxID=446462 RepID=C6WD26_ACTMD|nr:MerR family transcriptional regulator [Actinosynnema mirum]ACU37645.1 transcriptional regulator, MerR family [Actinosynnema mirum DSM 43827]AXX31077.1 Regulatory protein, MerR [Actinosynnema pretiosum subsp. pretiosum]
MTEALIRIGELAAKAGVSPRTVDHYTNLGLLMPAGRSGGNYRLYREQDADVIALVKELEAGGLPLEEIAKAMTSGEADVTGALERIGADLDLLKGAADAAAPELQGLLAVIAGRVQSLITIALQIPPDLLLP